MSSSQPIAIIGAMDCEIERFKSILKNTIQTQQGFFIFYKGEIYDKTVIIAKSGVGKVASAVCTQILADKYNPCCIINTGVAGGLDNNMNIGDVILADKLVQHDFDATAIGYAKGYICNGINPKEPTYFYSDKELTEKFKNILSKYMPDLTCHKGTIASGDMFVSSNDKKKEIKEYFSASAVEMEGASIAHTASLNNIPFIVIRAISDLADDNASNKLSLTESDIAHLSAGTVEMFLKYC